VLKGSFIFAADLIRAMHDVGLSPEVEFIFISSYGAGTTSGEVRVLRDIDNEVAGRDVLLIDDILESGKTLKFTRELMLSRGAKSCSIAVLLDKRMRRRPTSMPTMSASTAPTISSSATAWTWRTPSASCPSSVWSRAKTDQPLITNFAAFRNRQPVAANIAAMAKLLIVEDDESVRTLAARALERAGHKVDVACDGAEGLDSIHAERGGYDLIVSDIRMPEMDGIEMAQNAARAYPGLPILLMTGYADQRERAEELDAIIIDVVQKPFTLNDIRDRVSRALAAQSAVALAGAA
jgi:two-component system cell cycle response regulator CpdR